MKEATHAERFARIRSFGLILRAENGATLRPCSPNGLALLSAPDRSSAPARGGRTWTLADARAALGIR